MTVFPNGFVAVGAINSKAASSGSSMATLFKQAYEEATTASISGGS
jgi:hypothetical protein